MQATDSIFRPEARRDWAAYEGIRYAQCWEDADVLLAALQPGRDATCLSVASAGDNVLALAGHGAGRVIAVDLNPAQLACLALKMAAFAALSHEELLAFSGELPCKDRPALYARCRKVLTPCYRPFWDHASDDIARGFARRGKFERFLDGFRQGPLALIQGEEKVTELLALQQRLDRREFYKTRWNTLWWQLSGKLVFSRLLFSRLARHPDFTRHAEQALWPTLQQRIFHALVTLNPAANPYVRWILTGHYGPALPWHLRPENFAAVREGLSRIELFQGSLESLLQRLPDDSIDACNLSDVFEYLPVGQYHEVLNDLARVGAPGCRLAYWNLLVHRRRPAALTAQIISRPDIARPLFRVDKAFFYSDFVVEEVAL